MAILMVFCMHFHFILVKITVIPKLPLKVLHFFVKWCTVLRQLEIANMGLIINNLVVPGCAIHHCGESCFNLEFLIGNFIVK